MYDKKDRTINSSKFRYGNCGVVAKNRGISIMDALRIFLASKTHEMLENDEMKLWYFSPLAVFDMWENEEATGDPGNSLYLRGDEIE